MAFLAIIGLALAAGWFIFRDTTSKLPVARVDIEAVLKEHPRWGDYTKLQKEMEELAGHWSGTLNEQGAVDWQSKDFGQKSIERQVDQIKKSFGEEVRLKQLGLKTAMEGYFKTLAQEYDKRFKEKLDALNKQLNEDLQAKVEHYKKMAELYRQVLEAENQLTLSNLQLKLAGIDVAKGGEEARQEQQKIQSEIDRIKRDIEEKSAERQKKLNEDLRNYVKLRKEELEYEIIQYKKDQESHFKADLEQYKKKLEADFSAWMARRQKEVEQDIKLRQDQKLSELNQTKAKLKLFQLQLDRMRDDMLQEVRLAVKKVAQKRKLTCVFQGEITNVNLFDLTPHLQWSIKTGDWRRKDNDN